MQTSPSTTVSPRAPTRRRILQAACGLGAAAVGCGWSAAATAAQTGARVVPALDAKEAAASAASEVAVIAGGCFWGVQGVFQHVVGVSSAVSGYAGGDRKTAVYETVGRGMTGHAEAVQITYDPRQIRFARILQIHFSVAHDPTQLNRQGPDTGPQYRSAVFPLNEDQARIARAYVAQLNQARVFKDSVVTTVEPGRSFYPAEEYHQDFLTRNPTYPYIVHHDLPKLADLKNLFPQMYRATPVLVLGAPKAS